MNKSQNQVAVALGTVLLAFCLYLYDGKSITAAPDGHHAWAMSDYYAFAVRYAQDTWNLFLPRTFNLATEDGITSTDVPLPAWLAGGMMDVFDTDTPAVFRLFTLLVSLLGIVFFCKLLLESGISRWRAMVLSALFWLLPGALFYHIGFLPSVWAFNTMLIGLWALQRSRSAGLRCWWLAIALFTLAALLRKPYVLFLGALVFVADHPRKRWGWLYGMGVFGLWQVYDWWLMQQYGTLFLRQFLSPRSIGEAGHLALDILKKWGAHWYAWVHILWIIAAVVALVVQRYRKQWLAQPFEWRLFLAFAAAACGYFVLMMRQFVDHDYYAFDSFYPATLVGVWYLSKSYERFKYALVFEVLLLLAAVPAAKSSVQWYQRSEGFELANKTVAVYSGARGLLDTLGVPATAKMLVFEAFSTNGPLLNMGRRGYTLLSSRPEAQEAGLANAPDYAVCLDTNFIKEVVNDHPEVVKRLSFVGRNAGLWVFRPGNFPDNTLEKLLATDASLLLDSSLISQDEFLLSVSLPPAAGKKIVMSGTISADHPLKPTVALFKGGQLTAYLEAPLTQPTAGYRCIDLNVPESAADEMRVYLWNPDRGRVALEHFRISVLTLKPVAGLK